jgi:xylose isomerase
MGLVDLRGQVKRRTPQELVQHLKTFNLDLKFSAGIWYFAPGGGRFHDRYSPQRSIKERLDIAATLADYGLNGMEAHYPNEINEENLDLWKSFSRDTGIKVLTVIVNLFYDAQFEWSSLASPIPQARRAAIERTKAALQMNRDLNTDFCVVWPGGDGYENSFGLDFTASRDRFAEGLAEAMDAVPGVRVAEEPKPYEPRGHIFYGTTYEGILLCQKVESMLRYPENKKLLAEGHALCAMNPEVGHMCMAYEDPPYSFSMAMEYGRLAHTHWNSQPFGNYDQDMNVGVLSPEQTEASLYVMKMYGYQGYFGMDIDPQRMPVDVALKNCMDALRAANDRINELDHEQVIWSTEHPAESRGWLEAYLIRKRAAHPEKLPPLGKLPVKW